jgi:hypothetical protein
MILQKAQFCFNFITLKENQISGETVPVDDSISICGTFYETYKLKCKF